MPKGGVLEGKGWSGWSDSNRRHPAPKAGALTGLRHTPTRYKKIEIAMDDGNKGLGAVGVNGVAQGEGRLPGRGREIAALGGVEDAARGIDEDARATGVAAVFDR